MLAIIHLITNSIFTVTSIIGIVTIINKFGILCKVIDENKNDGYKLGFDKLMLDSIDEINRCVDSITFIAVGINKIFVISYDIMIGNKFIKKDKDGKIIICTKTKLDSSYKTKINELNSRVKKYQDELNKIKKNKIENDRSSNNSSNSTYSDVSDDSDDSSILSEKKSKKSNKDNDSSDSSVSSTQSSEDEDDGKDKEKNKEKDNDFSLE